jgi:hypothetical protein
MRQKIRDVVLALIVISIAAGMLMGTVTALGMLNVNFGNVEQGKTYTETVNVITSTQDFDNHFVIEKSGELAAWIDVTPQEFDLRAGDTQPLAITLRIPEDATLGEYAGAITAVGKEPAPAPGEQEGGAAVGYTVAVKSRLSATVVKPGAIETVDIVKFEAPSRVESGSVAKFDVSIKNTGNVPTTAEPVLTIYKGSETADSIHGAAVELDVEEEEIAKLYWDAEEDGTYTAVVIVTCAETTTTSDPINLEVGKGGFALPTLPAFAVLIAILTAFAFTVFRRKR